MESDITDPGYGYREGIGIDGLLNKGEPLWSDMKWNALGVGQGVVFAVTITS